MKTKHFANRLTAFFIAVISIVMVHAQSVDRITAIVTDTDGHPLEFVNVVLLRADSTFQCGSVTDSTGRFTIDCALVQGQRLRVSLLGYEQKVLSQPFPSVIQLREDAVSLAGIEVNAARNNVKATNRGIAVDIENSPLAKIGGALDCLKQLPFIDGTSGSLSVIGSGKPAIYLNKRKLRGESELQTLTSADIKSVEILTNPPAKYGADVPAVILITTRRQAEGLAVTAEGNVTAAEKWSYSGKTGLNYHNSRGLTVFADAQYGSSAFRQTRRYDERFGDNGVLNTTTHASAHRRTEALEADAGFGLDFGKHSVGAKYTYCRTPKSPYASSATSQTNARSDLANITSDTRIGGDSWSHYLNAYADLVLPAAVQLRLDADYMNGRNHSYSESTEQEAANDIVNSNQTRYDLTAVKAELTRRMGTVELNVGGQYSLTNNRQTFISHSSAGQNFLTDSEDDVRQNLGAGWFSFDWDVSKRVNLYGGLRYEHVGTHYERNYEHIKTLSPRYNDWFPNVGLTLKWPLTVSLSYRATTSRPDYSQLENNYNYVTPTLWETGNPALQSTIRHKVGLDLSYRKTVVNVLFVRQHRPLGSIYSHDEAISANVCQTINLPDYNYLQIVAVQRFDIGAWHPTLQGMFYVQNLKCGEPERSHNKPLYQLFWNNRIGLPHGVYAYVNLVRLGKGDVDVIHSHGTWQASVMLNKAFRRWTVSLYANDVLGTWRQKFSVNTNNVDYRYLIKGASQFVQLTVSYRFNAAKSRYKGKSAAEDELERLK